MAITMPIPHAYPTDKHPPRVVSLLPSATEIVALLGGAPRLVGRSHECDFPPGLDRIPILTAQRTPLGTPAEIDSAVRDSLREGSSLYTLDETTLRSLRPDVILTQDLCEVCSIDPRTVQRVADSMSPRPQVVSLNPTTVEGVLDDVIRVGHALGLDDEARTKAVDLRERLFTAGEYVHPFADGPSLAFLEWTDPLFGAGHWTVQMIERAGARHPLNPTVPRPTAGAAAGPQNAERTAGKSTRLTPEALIASRPELLVVCPCGFGLTATRAAARELSNAPWWRDLPAVRAGRVAVVDGNQMFNRPGPRLVDAFEWLVGWMNDRPELIPRGFPWERFVS